MLKTPKILAFTLLSMLFAACGQQTPAPDTVTAQRVAPSPCMTVLAIKRQATDDCPDPTDPAPLPIDPSGGTTLVPGAVILDSSAVVSYDYNSGTLTLSRTAITNTYAVGNTVIGGIVTPRYSRGTLDQSPITDTSVVSNAMLPVMKLGAEAGVPPRRITTINVDVWGRYVMTTSEAALTDVISDASLNYSRSLLTSEIVSVDGDGDEPLSVLSQQKIIKAMDLSNPACDTPGLSIYSISYKKDFDNNSNVAGCFDTSVDMTLQLRIKDRKVNYFESSVKLTEQVKLQLEADIASGELKVKKSIPLANLWYGPFTVMVGPVPLVITPYIKLSVGVEGSISGKLSYTASQVATYRGGVKYEGGSFKIINDRKAEVEFPDPSKLPPVKAALKVTLEAKPGLGFFVTVIAAHADGGVYGIIRAYSKVDIDPLRHPVWQVTAGPQFCAGFNLHVEVLLGLYDQSWTEEKCGAEIRLFENHSPDLGPTIPGYVNSWNKTELQFTLAQGQIEIYRKDSGYNTLVARLDTAKTFDLTPFIDPVFGNEFVIVAVAKRTKGILGSYSYEMGMKVIADGVKIWEPNDAKDSYTNSTEVYDFDVIPGSAILNRIRFP